jgi:transcriptional regulator with XRE-family HTH domain
MPNSNFTEALARAGLMPEQFADIIGVDPRTVERWVAGRTPYRRHRAAIARALDIPEVQLWPDTTFGPGEQDGPDQAVTIAAGEPGVVWGYADESGAPDPSALIADGPGAIDLLDLDGLVAFTDDLSAAIRTHASTERPVRVIRNRPGEEFRSLIGHMDVEVRIVDAPAVCWALRVGDKLLVAFNFLLSDAEPSLLELTRGGDDGLFARMQGDFDELWRSLDIVLVDADQLDGDDEGVALNAGEQPPRSPTPEEAPRESTVRSRSAPADEEARPRRRWPRSSS